MNDFDSIALDIVETWKKRIYRNECQSYAALQVLITEALKKERGDK